MPKKRFRTPKKKSDKYFDDISEESELEDTRASYSAKDSMSTMSSAFPAPKKLIKKTQAVIQGPLHTFNASLKERRRKLFVIAHHRHQIELDKINKNKPVMLNKQQFINSIQDKTWF